MHVITDSKVWNVNCSSSVLIFRIINQVVVHAYGCSSWHSVNYWKKSGSGSRFLDKYQYIELPELGFDELLERSDAGRICNIKLVKDHVAGETRLRSHELFDSSKTPFLISCCQHHHNPIGSQLLAYGEPESLICSCHHCIPALSLASVPYWEESEGELLCLFLSLNYHGPILSTREHLVLYVYCTLYTTMGFCQDKEPENS